MTALRDGPERRRRPGQEEARRDLSQRRGIAGGTLLPFRSDVFTARTLLAANNVLYVGATPIASVSCRPRSGLVAIALSLSP